MNIRHFETSDLDDVLLILRSNIPKYFVHEEVAELKEFLEKNSADYYVIKLTDRIVAAGGIALNSDQTVSLCWGMVHNDRIGNGLGRALTDHRIEKARERFGILPLVIVTSQHTEGFYKKYGFVRVEHTANGFGPGIDSCRMVLR